MDSEAVPKLCFAVILDDPAVAGEEESQADNATIRFHAEQLRFFIPSKAGCSIIPFVQNDNLRTKKELLGQPPRRT